MGRGNAIQRKHLHKYYARTFARTGTKTDGSPTFEEGSAILVANEDKRYLITAGHCLPSGNPDDLTAETMRELKTFSNLQMKRMICHKCEKDDDPTSFDIAIFEIEVPSDVKTLMFATLCEWTDDDEPDCENIAFGFPNRNRSMGEALELDFVSDKVWSVKALSGHATTPIKSLIKAFSGSGIIDFNDNGATCVGIIRALTTKDGVYSRVFGVVSDEILQLIHTNQTEDTEGNIVADIYNTPKEYIPRKCARVPASAMEAFFLEAHTLIDFITGIADNTVSNHIILAGAAQTGKSYELLHTASELQAAGHKVKLIELCKHPDLKAEDIDFHTDGILILDGLDEICTKEIDKVSKVIVNFAINHPNRKIMVSCRENFIEKISEGDFSVISLCDLSRKEVEEILRNRSDNPDLVLKEIKEAGVEELCTNPFNLTSILKIGNAGDGGFKLPKSIIEIYERFIDSLYQADIEKPEKEVTTSRDEATRLLKTMAFFMVKKGKDSITHDELLSAVGTEESISKLIKNSTVALVNGEYSFITNGIREYLAAEKLLDLDMDNIKTTVCIKDTDTIRPKMYNVVGFWLRHVSSQDKMSEEVIEWVRKCAPRLLLNCLPDSIDPDTRYGITVQILNKCVEINSLFDAFYTDSFQQLYNFTVSDGFNELLLIKLRAALFPSVDFYNTVCLCACIPWVSSTEQMPDIQKSIYKLLYEKIKVFGDKDNSQCLYYWIANNAALYENPASVGMLMDTVEEFIDPQTVSMICEIIFKSGMSDRYFNYLIKADELVHDKGYTVVPRYTLYAALGNVKELDHILKTLQLILDDKFRYKDYYEDEYSELLYNVFNSLLNCQNGQNTYLSVFEHLMPDKSIRFLDAKQTLVLKTMKRLNIESGILKEMTEEIQLLLNPSGPTEEEVEMKRLRAQRHFDILWDYPSFIKETERILSQASNNPEAWDLARIDKNGDFNIYLNQFVRQFCNWNGKELGRVRIAIKNQNLYESFRLERTVEVLENNLSQIEISQDKIDAIKSKATEILTNYIMNNARTTRMDFMSALKLFVAGYLDLDKDVIAGLLPYGHESFMVKTNSEGRESKTVFSAICDHLDNEEVVVLLREQIPSLQESSDAVLKAACRYLMTNGAIKDNDMLYNMMTDGPNDIVAYFLLDDFLKEDEYKNRIINDFKKFSPYLQLKIWKAFKVEPSIFDTLTSRLESQLPSFSKTDWRNTLQELVKTGNITALRLLSENKSELKEFGHFYHFNYSEPTARDYLIEILSTMKDYENYYQPTRQSIVSSIGEIAASSEDMLESTCNALGQKFGNSIYSRGLIEFCRNRRLTACDEME